MRSPVLWTVLGLFACGVGCADVPSEEAVVLHGNTHALARAEYDSGPTEKSLAMNRMILTLRIPDSRKAELAQLLAEQQDPASPNYHRWLTPEEFGARFGPGAEEIERVTRWLTAQGFSIDEVAKGGTWINFSGTAGAVETAFRIRMRDFRVGGELRHANATDPTIPGDLASVVAGVVSLHSFPRKAMNSGRKPVSETALRPSVQPQHTTGTMHAMSPSDFAIIYNVNALYAAGIDGAGQSIAIVGRSHPSAANWTTFRSLMGLPANAPQVIVNGADPGDLGADEDAEADLDVEWSGAVAKNATIKFVISASTASTDGVDLSAQYIVDNDIAPVMSTSFGLCEADLGTSENNFFNNLWAQAAAAGITSFVSSGDSGAAGCDSGSASSGTGRAISGLASTPYNVAVGGTQFNEGTGTYWSTSDSSYFASALSYIPEIAWNESGSVTGGSGLWSTGGGASSLYSKPSWQVAPGVPADGKRDVPDVSLSAAGHDGYLVRTQGALYSIGGTSASSPAFAGLMALINQKTGARQGNANPRLYELGAAQYGSNGPAVFHDTTTGSNSVPGTPGYICAAGYDLATGLGSVDAYALVNNWAGATAPDFTLAASPTSLSLAQGSSGSVALATAVSGGFNSAVSLSASGLPAGATASFSPASIAAPGSGSSSLVLTAGSTAAAGAYAITITAAGGGATHTASVSLALTSSGSSATAFSDGFEGTGWSTAQVAGAAGAWTLVSSSSFPSTTAHGGSKFADFNSYTSASGSKTRLYTPGGFAIPSGYGAAALTFWMYHDTEYASGNDQVQVQVSTDGTTWTSVGSAVSRYNGSTGWAQAAVDLSAYLGSSIWLGFLGISGYGNDLYLDDVSVVASGAPAPTYAVSGAVSLSGAGLSGATVTAGGKSATTTSGGGYTISGLVNGTYAVVPSLSGYVYSPASRSVAVNGADASGIDFTAAVDPGPTALFTHGFESTGWSTAQVSGTTGKWTLASSGSRPSASPHGSSKLAGFNSYTSSSGSQTRLYQSAGFAIASSYTSAALKFWMYHDTGFASHDDRVQVQVSTNGSTWSNVGSAISRYNGTTGWAQVAVDLSAYVGQSSVQLGFLGISAYGNDVYLDDVTVTAQCHVGAVPAVRPDDDAPQHSAGQRLICGVARVRADPGSRRDLME
jgi:pseudomonalisin